MKLPESPKLRNNGTNLGSDVGANDFVYEPINTTVLNGKIQALNFEQKKAFDRVTTMVEHNEKHRLKQCDCHLDIRPLRLFCSGVAGKLPLKNAF
jgi:hypothetical protein